MTDLKHRILPTVQKPARYTGGEWGESKKNKEDVRLRIAFCFPDTYEIGMSHLGMKILYSQFNARDDIWCERVFAPWLDFEEVMRQNNIPLFAIESRDPIKDFDFLGFTLQYEMSYTNILNMLDLAGVALKSAERTDLTPLVVAGGPCACNPEPLADFIAGENNDAAVEEKAKEILLEDEIEILVNLKCGEFSSTAWGCDLTYDYVKINGDYRT